MFIIVSNYLIPKGYHGITLFPFIFLKNVNLKEDVVILNHEKIHFRQQIELLVIPFYIWYFVEFIVRMMHYKDWDLAYRNISFEREAYANEKSFNYLKNKTFWSFLSYL
jgi:hypothetical protein